MSISLRVLAAGAVFALAGAGFASASHAATTAKPRTAQQQRMADCNKKAKGLHGAERKTFMSSCLRGKSVAQAPDASEAAPDKAKACKAEATSQALKGADRKSFISGCLKGDAAT